MKHILSDRIVWTSNIAIWLCAHSTRARRFFPASSRGTCCWYDMHHMIFFGFSPSHTRPSWSTAPRSPLSVADLPHHLRWMGGFNALVVQVQSSGYVRPSDDIPQSASSTTQKDSESQCTAMTWLSPGDGCNLKQPSRTQHHISSTTAQNLQHTACVHVLK